MCLKPISVKGMQVACGKCLECKIKKSTEWAYRICLESTLHTSTCMLTLTYNNENLPLNGSLVKSDLQKFMKRLRKHIEPVKVRYFACGEYGSKGRPHYHIILFGFDFEDKFFFKKDKKGSLLYRSPILEKLWQFGYSSIGNVTFDSAKYCAKYLQKRVTEKGRVQPFVVMSRRPGLGFGAFQKKWLDTDKIYVNGKYISIPRYYLDKFQVENDKLITSIREKRKERATVTSFEDFEQRFIATKERAKKFERIFKNYLDNDKML